MRIDTESHKNRSLLSQGKNWESVIKCYKNLLYLRQDNYNWEFEIKYYKNPSCLGQSDYNRESAINTLKIYPISVGLTVIENP